MKIICSKKELLKGVNIVLKAVPSRTTMKILECILIKASNQQISLTSNDMELGIETILDGEIKEAGMIALDAKVFSEIVRKLPDSDVVISTDSSLLTTISCEKARFTILGKEGEEFSALPEVEKNNSLALSEYTLKEVIRQTIFSISDSESNKMMTGELFEIKENSLRVVSLDGHRISIRNVELANSYEPRKLIVPGKALQEIFKILPGEVDSRVQLFFTDNHILFEYGETKVVSRLIEGEFFHIDQMLSSDYDTKLMLNRKDFLECIDRSILLLRESDKTPIVMNVSDNQLELKLRSYIGAMREEMAAEKEGKDILIGFNPKFLMDALRAIDDEEVVMYMVNPKAPCFIKDDENKFIYLILPINFNAESI